MAGVTGLEPAASCVTGERSNQLNYTPLVGGEIELRHPQCKRGALPAELTAPIYGIINLYDILLFFKHLIFIVFK